MNSSFSYLGEKDPLAKITTSVQEWCGQAFMQLNKKNNLSISSHSYFEGEADQAFTLEENQSTFIPRGEIHRLQNEREIPLEVIEIQTGDYFGEDDIIRLEDDYQRS